ncbi:glycine N-acyltransferase-like protein 3 isoform X2 [Takifugu flavidus]|uniref:glycine N-acyltransferase-like protein 3 isoform X2 n=1 Tax=Takifugu flavidus TaxID=433684 RepID=UPI0025441385|nr:glycine N-acyltransferase-like protein 3 isoform X2 [Takifugu flavidus]
MKILSKAEIVTAEKVLLKHLPRSFKVYGYLRAINKDRPTVVEVLVDSWPEFKVIICRSKCENESVGKTRKKVSYYCTDENALRKMLVDADVIDWSTYFIIGGLDMAQISMVKEVSSQRKVNTRTFIVLHLMYLIDSHHLLPEQEVPSQVASRISSLDLSHVDLVNKTWKFGGDEKGYSSITNLITNFPSCCITDEHGQPVSWILLYDYCAMGLLYTLPEHRGKGHAKVLISTMARRLIAEGFPVYCFIEEDNTLSYKAFTNLGFIEDPTYRAAWLEFNF